MLGGPDVFPPLLLLLLEIGVKGGGTLECDDLEVLEQKQINKQTNKQTINKPHHFYRKQWRRVCSDGWGYTETVKLLLERGTQIDL